MDSTCFLSWVKSGLDLGRAESGKQFPVIKNHLLSPSQALIGANSALRNTVQTLHSGKCKLPLILFCFRAGPTNRLATRETNQRHDESSPNSPHYTGKYAPICEISNSLGWNERFMAGPMACDTYCSPWRPILYFELLFHSEILNNSFW